MWFLWISEDLYEGSSFNLNFDMDLIVYEFVGNRQNCEISTVVITFLE